MATTAPITAPLPPAQRLLFVRSLVAAAQGSERNFRVPASVTIAQAILESAWGQSRLAREANNYFGIKADTFSLSFIELPTTEFVKGVRVPATAKFALYADIATGFLAHARLLSTDKRYLPAMAHCDDPFEFAAQLAACGYSTNPGYAHLLAELITEFNLTQYDISRGASTGPSPAPETGSNTAPATS